MPQIVLDERLAVIADIIAPCDCVADIGADHGRLGCHLLQQNKVRQVQFLDISAESLSKSRQLVEKLGLGDRATFSVGDGARAMQGKADYVVIAGMGGQLIADIVERGAANLGDGKLVLQPNVAQKELRQRLMQQGYRIDQERIVRASGRLYVVMAASKGAAQYDDRQLLVGPKLLCGKDPNYMAYAERQLRIVHKALSGARAGDAPWLEELEREHQIWEGIVHGGDSAADRAAD